MSIWKLAFCLFAMAAPIWAQCRGASALFINEDVRDLGTVTQGVPFQFPVQILFTNQTGPLTPLVTVVGPLTDVTFDPDLASKIGRQANVDFVVTATATAAGEQTAQIGALAGVSAGTSITATAVGDETAQIVVNVACGGVPAANPGHINIVVHIEPGGSPTYGQNSQTGNRAEPVSTATGELFGHDQAVEVNLGGPLPLFFQRYYASYLEGNGGGGALGRNWRHNFEIELALEGDAATVTGFRGETAEFRLRNGEWQLSSVERHPFQLVADNAGGFRFLDPRNRIIYSLDGQGRLTQIADRHGNALQVTQGPNSPAAVTGGLGRSLTFTYTGRNLTQVSDSAGRQVLFEQTAGNLTAWIDANAKRWTYAYTAAGALEGLMTAETRPLGTQPFRQEFDGQGRVLGGVGAATVRERLPRTDQSPAGEPACSHVRVPRKKGTATDFVVRLC